MNEIRTLIVDDNKVENKLLQNYLRIRHSSLHITPANDAFEALDLLRRASFDLVITDYFMPGIAGLELIEFVRVLSPDSQIIVISGLDYEELEDLLIQSKIGHFLPKPVRLPHLSQVIEEVLEESVRLSFKKMMLSSLHSSFSTVSTVKKCLVELNDAIGAYCCVIAGETDRYLVSASAETLPLDRLVALVKANIAASKVLSHLIENDRSFNSIMMEGNRYNIGCYVLTEQQILIIVFDKLITIDQVKHHVRKAIPTLTTTLLNESFNNVEVNRVGLDLDSLIDTSINEILSEDI